MILEKDPIIKKAFIILIIGLIFTISIVILSNYFFINQLQNQEIRIDENLIYKFISKIVADRKSVV